MKSIKLLFSIVVPFLITSCGAGSHVNSRNNPMASLFDKSTSSEVISNIDSSIDNPSGGTEVPVYEHIDIDLTTMNSTMVYSEVYNMMLYPSQYIDKVVKAKGPFVTAESTDPNYCYPAVLIQDATACCGNGLEFLLYGIPRCTSKGGNGYPSLREEVTIVGVFKTYIEEASMYVHLVDAIWLK